jgi:hypothetical protein
LVTAFFFVVAMTYAATHQNEPKSTATSSDTSVAPQAPANPEPEVARPEQEAPTPQAVAATVVKDVTPKPVFVALRETACENYNAGSNEIKKSAVYNDFFKSWKKNDHKIDEMIGEVAKIETNTGGEYVQIKLRVGFGTVANTNGFTYPGPNEIKKNTALYKVIGDLAEGDKVRFSAKSVEPKPNPFSESDATCGDEWKVKYTAISKE